MPKDSTACRNPASRSTGNIDVTSPPIATLLETGRVPNLTNSPGSAPRQGSLAPMGVCNPRKPLQTGVKMTMPKSLPSACSPGVFSGGSDGIRGYCSSRSANIFIYQNAGSGQTPACQTVGARCKIRKNPVQDPFKRGTSAAGLDRRATSHGKPLKCGPGLPPPSNLMNFNETVCQKFCPDPCWTVSSRLKLIALGFFFERFVLCVTN